MHPIIWILLLVIAVVAVPLLLMIPLTMPLAKKQYRNLLVRESSDKWKRENSCPTDKEYSEMYETACAWGASVADKTRDVSITNDGLKLCGKFTDLGSDRTVLILCGRAEGSLHRERHVFRTFTCIRRQCRQYQAGACDGGICAVLGLRSGR